jgi:hypothetical protein
MLALKAAEQAGGAVAARCPRIDPGGHHPGDLAASLPVYAANANWLAIRAAAVHEQQRMQSRVSMKSLPAQVPTNAWRSASRRTGVAGSTERGRGWGAYALSRVVRCFAVIAQEAPEAPESGEPAPGRC